MKTQCHPDGSPKVTGGTTASGAVMAVAVSGGMTFADGTAEAKVTLQMAKILKDRLLAEGYDVLMLRDGDDVQLDNVARSVLANRYADCHIPFIGFHVKRQGMLLYERSKQCLLPCHGAGSFPLAGSQPPGRSFSGRSAGRRK